MKTPQEKSTMAHDRVSEAREPIQERYPNAPTEHPESKTPPPTPTKGYFSEVENLPVLSIKNMFSRIIGPLDRKCR